MSQRNDVNFQDLGSISRTFKKYLRCELVRDPITNDLVLGTAARHLIVHSASRIDRKFKGQIASAVPRSLKPMVEGDHIRFSLEEVRALGDSMKIYVERLEAELFRSLAE